MVTSSNYYSDNFNLVEYYFDKMGTNPSEDTPFITSILKRAHQSVLVDLPEDSPIQLHVQSISLEDFLQSKEWTKLNVKDERK